MHRPFAAAGAYFSIVFGFAFVLGVVRALLIAPRTGDVVAVLIETPIVLFISWLAASWTARRFSVPAKAPARLTMGLTAFALLMVVETSLSLLMFDRPLAEQAATLATPAGAIGLLGQVVFGVMPLLAARRR